MCQAESCREILLGEREIRRIRMREGRKEMERGREREEGRKSEKEWAHSCFRFDVKEMVRYEDPQLSLILKRPTQRLLNLQPLSHDGGVQLTLKR